MGGEKCSRYWNQTLLLLSGCRASQQGWLSAQRARQPAGQMRPEWGSRGRPTLGPQRGHSAFPRPMPVNCRRKARQHGGVLCRRVSTQLLCHYLAGPPRKGARCPACVVCGPHRGDPWPRSTPSSGKAQGAAVKAERHLLEVGTPTQPPSHPLRVPHGGQPL